MNKRWIVTGFAVCMIALTVLYSPAFSAKKEKETLTPKPPRFVLWLSLHEMMVFDRAARFGVTKYGGQAEFTMRLAREDKEVVYMITIRNPQLIGALAHWMAEQTTALVNQFDFEKLDDAAKAELKTIKSVNAGIAQAMANPIRDPAKFSGMVIESDEHLYLKNEQGKYLLTGDRIGSIKQVKDKPVLLFGLVKVKDQIEVMDFTEKKKNRLEMFVMSQCPYAKSAEISLIETLESLPEETRPSLDISYIFYKKIDGKGTFFTSLGGGEETQENIVQMLIRDHYPDLYYAYLLKRANSDAPWAKVAREVGMTGEDIKIVRDTMKEKGGALAQKEYDYVAGLHQILDDSPTFVWEGERVKDIRIIEAFKGIKIEGGDCSRN